MLGTIVDVEPYIPYLETDEHLESIDLKGLPKELVNEIALMNLKGICIQFYSLNILQIDVF